MEQKKKKSENGSQIQIIEQELNAIKRQKDDIDAKKEAARAARSQIEVWDSSGNLKINELDFIYISPAFGATKPQITYQTYETLSFLLDNLQNAATTTSDNLKLQMQALDRRIKQMLCEDMQYEENHQDQEQLYEQYKLYNHRLLLFMTNNIIKDEKSLHDQFVKEVREYLTHVNSFYYTPGYVNVYNTHVEPYITQESPQLKDFVISAENLNYIQYDTRAELNEEDLNNVKDNFKEYRDSMSKDDFDQYNFIKYNMYRRCTKQFSTFKSYDIQTGKEQNAAHSFMAQSNEHKLIFPTMYGIVFEIILLKNKAYPKQKSYQLLSDFKLNQIAINDIRQRGLQMQAKSNKKQPLLINRLYKLHKESFKYNMFGIQNNEYCPSNEYWVIGNNYQRQDHIQNGVHNRFMQFAENYKFTDKLFNTNANESEQAADDDKETIESIQNDLNKIKALMKEFEVQVYQLLCIIYQIEQHVYNRYIQQQNISQSMGSSQ